MDIRSIIASAPDQLGKEIHLSGTLFSGESTFVTDGDPQSSFQVALPFPLVQDALLDSVPVYLGGQFLYVDSCSITGILRQTETSPYQFILYPSRIEIARDGDVFVVDF